MELKSYPRLYFELLALAFFLVMGFGLSKAFLPIMAYGMDPTGVLVGFVTSAWFFSRVFIELPSGLIAVRVGRRNLVVGGFLLSMVGSLICAFSTSIYTLIVGVTVLGSGTSLFFMSSTSLLFDLFKLEERGRAVGTFQGIESIGMFLGAPIGAIVAGFIGFSNIFILTSMILFFAFVTAFLSRDLKKLDSKAKNQFKSSTLKKNLGGLKSWSLFAVNFVNLSRMLVTQGVMLTAFPLYLDTHLNMSLESIGLVIGVRTGGLICATLISGRLSDRMGRKPLIAGGLILGGVCLYLYTLASSFEETMILATLDGVGSGFIFVPLTVLMSELVSPSVHSGAIGLYRTFMDIGGLLGPIIFMLLYALVDAYTPFWTASTLFFFNTIIIVLIKKNHLTTSLNQKRARLASARGESEGSKGTRP